MAPDLGFVPLPCQMPSLSFRAPRASEHERLVVGQVEALKMLAQLGLNRSGNGTVRRPAPDLGGPKADPPLEPLDELSLYPDHMRRFDVHPGHVLRT